MTPKTILACLTTPEAAPALSEAGAALASRFGAHLVGLHTIEALMVYPSVAMHVPAPAFESFNAAQAEQAEAIRVIFEAQAAGRDFPAEWRLVKAESVTAAERIVESARASDLVLAMQADRETDRPDQRNVQEAVIREGGRPVLILPPRKAPETLGERVLVGWSNTHECARAIHDAIPLMAEGAAVRMVQIGGGRIGDAGSAMTEMAAALDRHGARAEIASVEAGPRSIHEALLREALEFGADMIAVGAFGHSRAYDFVVGAVTGRLMREADLPVLFAR